MLNEFRTQQIRWDKATRKFYDTVQANASDSNGRKLRVQITDDGMVEDLTGATLSLYWESRDGKNKGLDALEAVDVSKGEFELFYTTGMLSNVGRLNAALVLVDSTGKTVSDWFTISNIRGIDEDAIESSNEFSVLTQALIKINDLEDNYAPRLNEVTAQLAHKATKGEIVSQDLSTATDDGKIRLLNLSEEVHEAMAGTAPVISSVADGSITSNKYADQSIARSKLTQSFAYNGTLDDSKHLDTDANREGYYLTIGAVGGLPSGYSGTGYLQVSVMNNRYVIQRLFRVGNTKTEYIRYVDLVNGSVENWTKHDLTNTIADGSITREKLADSLNIRPALTNVDLNTVLDEGVRVAVRGCTNTPLPDDSANGLLVVQVAGIYIVQTYHSMTDLKNTWIRRITNSESGGAVFGEWTNQSGGSAQSFTSHLENKKIVFFGTSIIDSSIIPELVAQRTGATTYNCAFGGTKWANHNDPSYDAFSMYRLAEAVGNNDFTYQDTNVLSSQQTRLNTLKSIDFNDVDIVVIEHGANDMGIQIGTDDDGYVSNEDFYNGVEPDVEVAGTTLKGAINYTLYKLWKAYPHLKILLVSPLWRARQASADEDNNPLTPGDGKDVDYHPSANGIYFKEIVEAIEVLSRKNRTSYLDMFNHSGINRYTQALYMPDGLHTNEAGEEVQAAKISGALLANF